MNNPKVTVLMPVYNGEKYICEAIESILAQTFRNFEFLIIDDGCTDRSIERVDSYTDSRIRVVHNDANMGLAATLNRGIDLAHGEYIARMDCDDISLPMRLEKQVRFMDENRDIGICGTWIKVLMGENYIKKYPQSHEAIKCNLLFEYSLAHPAVMIRKDALLKHGLCYDVNYKHADDYELWTRCSNIFKLANIPEVLVKYRRHPGQLTALPDAFRKSFEISVKHLSILYKITSDSEASLHRLFFPKQYTPSIDMLIKGHEWLCKLCSENAKKRVFPEPEFSRKLAERWLFLCKEAGCHGYRVFVLYWNSPLQRTAAQCFVETTKLLVKCLLKI